MNCRRVDSKSGVIAVLFLFVAAFVFGAISLSMQTGQMIERRISADQAADSAVVAFASKSAQGLNFISANNLAIAGASHMVGALHLSADILTAYSIIWKAKPFCQGGQAFDAKDYLSFYEIFRPVSKLYIKSALGLTNLNGVIQSTFPYLGMIDAVRTGGANSPSTIILPFGAPASSSSPPAQDPNSTFASTVAANLKTAVTRLIPNYKGLTRINSDETFCVSLRASKAMGERRHDTDQWLTDLAAGTGNTGVQIIGKLMDLTGKITGALTWALDLFSFQVGFSGCGFGEEGPTRGGGGKSQQIGLANLLINLLKGPISGRTAKLTNPNTPMDTTKSIILSPAPSRFAVDLKNELNTTFSATCAQDANQKWKIESGPKLESKPGSKSGVCLLKDSAKRKYLRNSPNFQAGTPIQNGEHEQPSNIFLSSYTPVCFGTSLFDWQSYSGIQAELDIPVTKPPTTHPYNPPISTPPGIPIKNESLDLCPEFEPNHPQTSMKLPDSDRNVLDRGQHSFINLNRGDKKTLLEPIIFGYRETVPGTLPPMPRIMPDIEAAFPGKNPVFRLNALSTINKYIACIDDNSTCDWPSLQGYKNKDGVIFKPDLTSMNWLCPIGDQVTSQEILKHAWKFLTTDPSRWEGNYKKIQDWHNSRVDAIITAMKCDEWVAFNNVEATKQPKPANSRNTHRASGAAESNDYCSDSAHMCWQKALQNSSTPGKDALAKGNLSFLLPKMPTAPGPTELERSLHYATLTFTPLRTDQLGDINGSSGGALPHCPSKMEVNATLSDAITTVPVCDIVPVIGMLSRTITDANATASGLDSKTLFGAGDVNLASGGAMNAANDMLFGRPGFISIAQSTVRFKNSANPSIDGPLPPTPAKPITPKNYTMFWPNWYPAIEPSRVMSRIMPAAMAPLLED